ncbi:MAG: GAF domain-containing sensor histidine kinase [Methanomassiliicoccales archaeon]|nr:GAF domain-containing sensor histidine kinase [Methanomassiliicoccales archaeon]
MPVSTTVLICESVAAEARKALDLEGLEDVDLAPYRTDSGDPRIGVEDLRSKLQPFWGSEGAVCIIGIEADLSALDNVPRGYSIMQMSSCAELLAGPGLANDLLSKGAIAIVPWMLGRWRETLMASGPERVPSLPGFSDTTTEVVLLDTGLGDWSQGDLEELTERLRRPCSSLFVGLDYLRLRLSRGVIEARLRSELEVSREESTAQARMRSDYALAFDLLERISRGTDEERVTGSIIDVLHMLFSPGEVDYYALHADEGAQLFDYERAAFVKVNGGIVPSLIQGANQWDEASNGFRLKVEHKGKVLGVAALKDLSFPELSKDYLNLASQLSVVFGLAVANARAFRSLKTSEAQVERAFALESTMLSISQGFFGRPDFDRAANEALARVGEAVGCSRVLLLQHSQDRTSLTCTHEWTSHGTSAVRPSLSHLAMEMQDWLTEKAQHEGTVRALGLSSMGHEERERLSLLIQDGVSSMLLAPVLVEGRRQGLVCLQRIGEEKAWEADETSMLRFLAQNLSVAMQRRKAQEDMAKLAESVTMSNKVLRHDIRNELMVLSGSLQLYDMKKEEKQLDRAKRSAVRLTEILDHFKELDSFLQSSKALFPVDLRQTIDQVMATHQLSYLVQGDAKVQADFAISSVIDNLVRNAKRHGEAESMTFHIVHEGDFVVLTVADDGTGIPEEARPKLFQEGFSYGERRSTGLGLFWIRKTMERYGGWAELAPSSGKGAAFVLAFHPSQ